MGFSRLIAATALAAGALLAAAPAPASASTVAAPATTTPKAQLGVMGPFAEYGSCAIAAGLMEEQGYTVSPCDWSLGGWYFAYF